MSFVGVHSEIFMTLSAFPGIHNIFSLTMTIDWWSDVMSVASNVRCDGGCSVRSYYSNFIEIYVYINQQLLMILINSNKEDLSTIQAKDVTINSCPSYSNIAHMHLIFWTHLAPFWESGT